MAFSNNSTPTGYFAAGQLNDLTPSFPFSSASRRRTRTTLTPSKLSLAHARSPLSTFSRASVMADTFQLPDINNLTALVEGNGDEGTPIFSAEKKTRWLRQAREYREQHSAIRNAPVPVDEKAIYASLCILKEKIALLEQEKAAAERRADDSEAEFIRMKAEIESEQMYRRSDSALGASEDEDRAGNSFRAENIKLQAEVKSMQHRLDAANAKIAVKDITMKRCLSERDTVVTQLGTALINVDDLQKELEALQKENETLREEIVELRAENNDLHTEQFEIRREIGKTDAINGEAEKLRAENNDLRRNVVGYERTVSENAYLRDQLDQMRAHHSQETQEIQFREGDARRKAERKMQRMLNDQYQLQAANDNLKSQLERAKHQQQAAQAYVQDFDDTTRSMDIRVEELHRKHDQVKPHAEREVQLQKELDRITAKHSEHSAQWVRMETELRAELDRLRPAISTITTQSPRKTSPTKQSKRAHPTGVRGSPSKSKLSIRDSPKKTKTLSRINAPFANLNERHSSAPVLGNGQQQLSGMRRLDDTLDIDLSALDIQDARTDTRRSKESRKRQPLGEIENVFRQPSRSRLQSKRSADTVRQDETLLSTMDTAEIAGIRIELEEERKRRRAGKHSLPAPGFDAVSLDMPEVKQYNDSEHRSKRQRNDRTAGIELADVTGTKDGRESVSFGLSQVRPSKKSSPGASDARRRSAPEMTSAYILPDITLQIPATGPGAAVSQPFATDGSCLHNSKNCTVCYQAATSSALPREPMLEPPTIPKPVPVSDAQDNDEDATMRPATSPAEALAKVLKQLEDELAHDKKDLVFITQILEKHNAALASRKREHYTRKVSQLNESIARKSQQIYDLHDVLEGQKSAGQLLSRHKPVDLDNENEVYEQVEETLMGVGFERAEARQRALRGKRVVVKSVSDHDSTFGGDASF